MFYPTRVSSSVRALSSAVVPFDLIPRRAPGVERLPQKEPALPVEISDMNFWKLALTTLIIVASIGASARAGNNLVTDGDFSVPYMTGGWIATPGFAGASGDSPGNPGGAYNSPTGFGPLGPTQI